MDAGSRPLHGSLLAKRGYRNRGGGSCPRYSLTLLVNHNKKQFQKGETVKDKLYDIPILESFRYIS